MERTPSLVVGPFGGNGGDAWNDGLYTTIRSMIIRCGQRVDMIRIEYDDNGASKWSPWHGNGQYGGWSEHTVQLNYPDEFLTNISGYADNVSSIFVVRSLTLTSNKKTYGPFGEAMGKYFSTSSIGGKIVGLLGRKGWALDSIGASIVPHDMISIGPFGGDSGIKFDDGVNKKIKQINVRYGDMLDSIQTVYEDNNGNTHWSDEHGTQAGGILVEVKIDNPAEYLHSMSGFTKIVNGQLVIQSIKFHSNVKEYGPYGKEEGQEFSTSTTNGKMVGFFGNSDLPIKGIGAHFVPLP